MTAPKRKRVGDIMKKLFTLILAFVMMFSLVACSGANDIVSDTDSGMQTSKSETEVGNPESGDTESSETETDETNDTKILIAYFSREDENYGVGYIEKGNTQIIAEMIAEETGGTLFEIERTTPYPSAYDDCTDEAKREQNENARPDLTATVDDFSSYDVIYLGYPIWWGDMPMAVYTFLESYDFSDKTVIPFCTHAGSGLSGTVNNIKEELPDATVLDGLAIRGSDAQNNHDTARNAVSAWIK